MWLCEREHVVPEETAVMWWLGWHGYEWATRLCGNCGYGGVCSSCGGREWYPIDWEFARDLIDSLEEYKPWPQRLTALPVQGVVN